MNNLPKVEREAPRPGIEPATSRLQAVAEWVGHGLPGLGLEPPLVAGQTS